MPITAVELKSVRKLASFSVTYKSLQDIKPRSMMLVILTEKIPFSDMWIPRYFEAFRTI